MPNARRILIVDDDAELANALVEQLALHEEFEAVAVDNAAKGMQAAKNGHVDLVIMDVGLPDVDGREAVRDQCGCGPHARGRGGGLAAGMPAADDDDVEVCMGGERLHGRRCNGGTKRGQSSSLRLMTRDSQLGQ